MGTARNEEIIVGLDIGTTKVSAIVGETSSEGIAIIGVGSHPSRGLRKGVVVNIEATIDSIRSAVVDAEQMAGVRIGSVIAGIAGGHIRGFTSPGIVTVQTGEITQIDVDRVLEQACAVDVPADRKIIHAIPQEFIVDRQDGVKEPVGMNGKRIEARVHLITAAVTSVQNIVKCAERCGLTVSSLVLEQLASAESVLEEDEKEIGVALIDIGGGTTDIVLYIDGSVVSTMSIGLGGVNLTNDLAQGLRTPRDEAERLKQRHGCAMASLVPQDEKIEVPSVGGRGPRSLPRRMLSEIIEPRVEEIFTLAQQAIHETGLGDRLHAGAVITGGTTAMTGMAEVAESVLGMQVRVGSPRGFGGLTDIVKHPMYATGVGLVLHEARAANGKAKANGATANARASARGGNVMEKVRRSMGDWLREIF